MTLTVLASTRLRTRETHESLKRVLVIDSRVFASTRDYSFKDSRLTRLLNEYSRTTRELASTRVVYEYCSFKGLATGSRTIRVLASTRVVYEFSFKRLATGESLKRVLANYPGIREYLLDSRVQDS